MELMFALVVVIGLAQVARSLRAWGCLSCVMWMLVGIVVVWFFFHFMSAGIPGQGWLAGVRNETSVALP